MKKTHLENYLMCNTAPKCIATACIKQHAKEGLLEGTPKINDEFLKHAEVVHKLILDPYIPDHLRESLLEHFRDIEEILGAHENLPHEDDDYDNTGFDIGGLLNDDSNDQYPDEKTTEMKKSFLFKATTMPEEQAHDLQKTPFRPHYEGVESKQLAPGLFMHSSKKETAMGNISILHHISSSPDPNDKDAQMAQGSLLHFKGDKHEFPSISSVKTKPGLEGKGLGKLLYHSMIKQHGGLLSDTVMSEADQRVWNSLAKHPAFDIKRAPEGNADHNEGRHVLKVKQDFEPEIPSWLSGGQDNLRNAQIIYRNQPPQRQPSLREAQQINRNQPQQINNSKSKGEFQGEEYTNYGISPKGKGEFQGEEYTNYGISPKPKTSSSSQKSEDAHLRNAQVINKPQPERTPSLREAQSIPRQKKEE